MLNAGIIQMQAIPLTVDENLAAAEKLLVQAVRDGALLVVLPEMFNVGYYLGEELMDVAETLEAGKTVAWLKTQSARHGIFILSSLYESYEGHFYNTMVMAGCDGSLQYYRKRNPALSEFAVWRRSPLPGPGIFDTPLGRIGGAICFDSFARETFEGFKRSAVELVMVVACWGMPQAVRGRPDLSLAHPILRLSQEMAAEVMPYQYATQLGVPLLFVNQAGRVRTPAPVPKLYPLPVPPLEYVFLGNSQVRDARGQVVLRAGSEDTAFCAVTPVDVKAADERPEITRVDLPPRYLSGDYYFIKPPASSKLTYYLANLLQAWGYRDMQREYEARRARLG